MPIDYRAYGPEWKTISAQVREEAGNRCEWCQVPNGARGARDTHGQWWDESQIDELSAYNARTIFGIELWGRVKILRIVLTVAHLDHDHTNHERSNLAALCQRCHLSYDRKQHAETRKRNRLLATGQAELPIVG